MPDEAPRPTNPPSEPPEPLSGPRPRAATPPGASLAVRTKPLGAIVVESSVDALAILVTAALAWRYAAYVPLCLGLIAVLAGVRLRDVVDLTRGGPGTPGGGLTAVLVALGSAVLGRHP